MWSYLSTNTPLYWLFSIVVFMKVGRVIESWEICLTMIPLSEIEIWESVNKGTESSIQKAELAANVAPVIFSTDTWSQSPPELNHMFTPLVMRLEIWALWTIGVEKSPADIPIPYLQESEAPCKSCPPPSITRSDITGYAPENRSIATLSAFTTVMLLILGLLV